MVLIQIAKCQGILGNIMECSHFYTLMPVQTVNREYKNINDEKKNCLKERIKQNSGFDHFTVHQRWFQSS